MARALRRSLLLVALLALVGGAGHADTVCFGTGCGGGGGTFDTASPTFTGTTTVDTVKVAGAAPTCAVTGGGAAATCNFTHAASTGSTATAGVAHITTDSSGTASTGTVTVTFTAAGANPPVCVASASNRGGAGWNSASVRTWISNTTTTTCVVNWANGTALAASDEYFMDYVIFHK